MPANNEIFKKYMNPAFIETGSYLGDGIQSAIDAGFNKVYSIELSPLHFHNCVERFKYNLKVHLVLGESHKELEALLKNINTPVTFWLDGHYSGPHTAKGEVESPLLQELEIISRHHIKNHTILIDDLRCWSIENHGFNTAILKDKCLDINSNYKFTLENGYDKGQTFIDDILVAYV